MKIYPFHYWAFILIKIYYWIWTWKCVKLEHNNYLCWANNGWMEGWKGGWQIQRFNHFTNYLWSFQLPLILNNNQKAVKAKDSNIKQKTIISVERRIDQRTEGGGGRKGDEKRWEEKRGSGLSWSEKERGRKKGRYWEEGRGTWCLGGGVE